jgi:hypothetical protein
MRTRNPRTIFLALAMLAIAPPALAQTLSLDWKVSHLSPENGASVFEKTGVSIRCEWDAVIAATGSFNEVIEWDGMFIADGAVLHYFKVKYDPAGGWFFKPGTTGDKDFPWETRPVYGTATNQFHGSAESTWTAAGLGAHTVGCQIGMAGSGDPHESSSKKGNNLAQSTITVKAMGQVTPGNFPRPPQKRTPDRSPRKAAQPILPKPSLSIAGGQAKFDPNCASLANLVTVQVKIQDANLPLSAAKGTVTVAESGGANLNGVLSLPAFALNEVKVVQLAIGTASSSVGALPGQHQLRISLNPQTPGGQPSFTKGADYLLPPITLPSGYCSGK